ncbi:MAG: RDD family protein [Bdellovibrionales bacterium]|nr:RDD family protein [Bdellovibrionales bacterium]
MDRKYLLEKAIRVAKLTRLIAKAIDVFIVVCFSIWFYPLGVVLGIIYMSVCDGMSNGQSAGKKFMGFAVKSLEDGSPCSYKQSVIRNLPFTLPLLVALLLPIIGWILGAILGVVLIGFELYLLYNLDSGHRLGDVMADTSVMANDDNFAGVKNRKTSWFTSNTTGSI